MSNDTCPAFLREAIPANPSLGDPFITLTYAQSLDAKIAGRGRVQVRLSGGESMRMTHWMRTLHDGIIIGVGTSVNDNPRLNVRLLPPALHPSTPTPIVLDPSLRTPPNARTILALTDAEQPHAKPPVLIADSGRSADPAWEERRMALSAAGARVCAVPMDGDNGRLRLATLRDILRSLSIRSLMVEGGATLIQQFLAEERPVAGSRSDVASAADSAQPQSTRPFIDCLIVTVAPVMIPDGYGLQDGAGVVSSRPLPLTHRHTEIMGRDAVFVMTA